MSCIKEFKSYWKKNIKTKKCATVCPIIIFLNGKTNVKAFFKFQSTIGKIYEIDACHCSSYVIRKPKESTIKEENGGLKAEIEDSMGNATGAAVLCLLLGETLV